MRTLLRDYQNVFWALVGAVFLQAIPLTMFWWIVIGAKGRPNAELGDFAIRLSHLLFFPFFFLLLLGVLCVGLGVLQSIRGRGFGNLRFLPHARALGIIMGFIAFALFAVSRAISFPIAKSIHAKLYPETIQY